MFSSFRALQLPASHGARSLSWQAWQTLAPIFKFQVDRFAVSA